MALLQTEYYSSHERWQQRHSLRYFLLWRFFVYAILICTAMIVLIPLIWSVITSFKSYTEIFINPYKFLPEKWVWKNFADIFQAMPFHLYFINTLKISTACVLGTLATSALAGYAFARLQFPGRDYLFLGYLATMMIPRQITLVPTFILMRWLGLLDQHAALILPGLFSAYGTFLLRQFFLTIPYELEEAAIIDGCGYFRRFLTIILPLSKPALATLGIFTLMTSWNDYLYPLVFLNSEKKRTLVLGLAVFRGDVDIQWNLLMAAVVMASAPLIIAFLAAQRFFVEGIATGGLKG
ncbi:MAG: carbohydrate ABC transporter permease [Firmicutes bacterium]|nr:carbohydrate ABC transporter permease [Bacillota bacterium]